MARASAFIKVTAPTRPMERGGLQQEVRADRYRGQRVRLSAYLKTSGVGTTDADGATLSLHVAGAERWLVLANLWRAGGEGRITGTTDWTRYEHVVDVPLEATLLRFGVSLDGSGQVWMDDVKLEPVGKEIPLTHSRGEAERFNWLLRRRMAARVKTALTSPRNLDLEL